MRKAVRTTSAPADVEDGTASTARRFRSTVQATLPGLSLCFALALVATLLGATEGLTLGDKLVEPIILALVLGILARRFLLLPGSIEKGAQFSATWLLEVSVFLLGASVDFAQVLSAGTSLSILITVTVLLSVSLTWLMGCLFGLHPKLAILVAVGNSICGNSAIAAVAPSIEASKEDVAAAISVTAIWGLIQVLLLPLLVPGLALTHYQYGVVAGLSVYAVPQAIAAGFAVSALSGQVATLVKLVRILFIGPFVLVLGLAYRRSISAKQPGHVHLVPWFVAGFLLLAALRSIGVIGLDWADASKDISTFLFVVSLAGLGLNVNLSYFRVVGLPLVTTVVLSILFLLSVAIAGTFLLGLT